MRRFSSYYKWREEIENGNLDIYFTTYLKEIGLKPIKGIEPTELVDVYVSGNWKRDIPAYRLDQTIEIKKRKVTLLDMTNENLCMSLYVINKSAKKSRDTKKYNYESKNFKTVSFSKTRENNLYDLKDCVIRKMNDEGILKLKGYHKQFDNSLLLYACNNFSFHMPINSIPEGVEFLGEIETLISAESKINDIGFHEAKLLLETYLENK